jgi:thiol:disulfide interchange protein/DsbC/DsbD-like thiol-disulfide interchange protein
VINGIWDLKQTIHMQRLFSRLTATLLLYWAAGAYSDVQAQPGSAKTTLQPPVVLSEAKSGAVRVDSVEAELVSEQSAIVPGQALKVGLRLKHDPNWHTYWRNAGDSGLPTLLQWNLPAGLVASDIQWPSPIRIGVGPLANYGFEGEVILPVVINVPAGFSSVNPVPLLLKAVWLVCREVCIPGEATMSLSLPVAPRATASEHASLFANMAKRTPSKTIAGVVHPGAQSNVVSLSFPVFSNATNLEFFPYTEQWILPVADQIFTKNKDTIIAALTLAEPSTKPEFSATAPIPIGVLIADNQVYEIAATATSAPVAFGEALFTSKVTHLAGKPKGSGSSILRDLSGAPSGAVSASTAPAPEPATPAVIAVGASNTNSGSFLGALGLALMGGLVLNLMPCVFPVLGLKVLGLTNRPESVRVHATLFSVGVVLSFVVLATLLVLLRSAGQAIGWGFQLQSPWFVAALIVLFATIGLNFSGVFELGSSLTRLGSLESSQSGTGHWQAFCSGVLAVVVATPCTAPFMGSALGYTLGQSAFQMVAVFAALGVGMALPYVFLAMRPSLMARMPKPGQWMQTFKHWLAFPMYLSAAWLIWVLGQQVGIDAVFAVLCALVLISASLWTCGRMQYGLAPRSVPSYAVVTALGLVGLWALSLAINQPEAAAQSQLDTGSSASTQNTSTLGSAQWIAFDEALLSQYQAQGRSVFVDFTAAWCVSCQVNKKLVLQSKEVTDAFASKKIVLMKADWTRRDPLITNALAKRGRNSVPLYLLYSPKQTAPTVLSEILSSSEVLAAVQSSSP